MVVLSTQAAPSTNAVAEAGRNSVSSSLGSVRGQAATSIVAATLLLDDEVPTTSQLSSPRYATADDCHRNMLHEVAVGSAHDVTSHT